MFGVPPLSYQSVSVGLVANVDCGKGQRLPDLETLGVDLYYVSLLRWTQVPVKVNKPSVRAFFTNLSRLM